MSPRALYRQHELSLRTLYAELKERVRGTPALLPGSPGTLVSREVTGQDYWYRSYYPFPGKRSESYVGTDADDAAHQAMQARIDAARWVTQQVSTLAKLGFQVADKGAAAVLVELYNGGLFEAGLFVVGTLAYAGWLNEYGAVAPAARTQDLHLARRTRLRLGAPGSFLESMQATQLPFVRVPGLPSRAPSTSVKLPGASGLRVDVLTGGPVLGATVAIPELAWHAQAIPFYDYLLAEPCPAALLAGGHCVPVLVPAAARLLWHRLYSSSERVADPTKAGKDLLQAATLAALLGEQEDGSLRDSLADAPAALRRAARSQLPKLQALIGAHPQALDACHALSARTLRSG